MLSNQIKNLRRSKKLSQAKLAEKLGVKKQCISNWENNNIMPSVEKVIRIADFFNVSADYLLGRQVQQADAPQLIDITGLTPQQVEHIQLIIDDLRKNEN